MLRVNAPAYNAHQAATVVADTDGLVRAMVGGRDYGASQYNRATDAARQPGSSFKIFVYMTALMTGKYHKDTIDRRLARSVSATIASTISTARAAGRCRCTGRSRCRSTPPRSGMSVKIGEVYWPEKKPYHMAKIAELGRSKIIETARAMGLTTPLIDTVSLPVGADEVKMIDMVGANAPARQRRQARDALRGDRDPQSRGNARSIPTRRTATPPVQVLPADKVAEMNNIMTHVVTEGTGRAAQIPGLVISGKTGTTNDSTNAWFNAFTGNLVGSVWFGNDDNTSMAE